MIVTTLTYKKTSLRSPKVFKWAYCVLSKISR